MGVIKLKSHTMEVDGDTEHVNLVNKLEKPLKSNINLLVSQPSQSRKQHKDDAENFAATVDEFELDIQNLRAFFLQSRNLHRQLNPQFYEQHEVTEMRAELSRKTDLIRGQQKTLSRYRSEIEVIQEVQVQALNFR